jgi:hypothetical protein
MLKSDFSAQNLPKISPEKSLVATTHIMCITHPDSIKSQNFSSKHHQLGGAFI